MADAGQNTRGDETRNLLLEAGLQLFGERGFEAVTTRQLAQQAGTNLAAIAYHFGGKRELYRAVLRQLVTDVSARELPAVLMLKDGIANAAGRPEALAALVSTFVRNLVGFFLDDAFMQSRAPLILREFSLPSEDFDIFYEGWLKPVHITMTRLAAVATGREVSDPDCAIRAHTIIGQIMVFGIARVILFRRLDWDGYTAQRTAEIARVVSESVLGSLGLSIPTEAELEMSHGR